VRLHLVGERLDKQLVDRNGVNAGRVDGIVLALRDGQPPLVTHVEVSPITLLSRWSPRLARWYARWDRAFGPDRGRPFRLPWAGVTEQGPTLSIDVDVGATPIDAVEAWLRRTIVGKIPGA
jgi:hypothetical protein